MEGKQKELVHDLKRQYRLWTPVFVVIVLATLASFMVGQGSNSGTSVYLVRVGGTATYVGFLAVVFSVAAAVARSCRAWGSRRAQQRWRPPRLTCCPRNGWARA